jgi:hypothetical protein
VLHDVRFAFGKVEVDDFVAVFNGAPYDFLWCLRLERRISVRDGEAQWKEASDCANCVKARTANDQHQQIQRWRPKGTMKGEMQTIDEPVQCIRCLKRRGVVFVCIVAEFLAS